VPSRMTVNDSSTIRPNPCAPLLVVSALRRVPSRADVTARKPIKYVGFRAHVEQNGLMASQITDVPGIRIGHVQKNDGGGLSGGAVVLPPVGTVGSVDVRGGGPGTHETDALDPTTLVSTVDAIVLTGGSAFGLASATGAQLWCEEQGRGFAVPGTVVPIVPAAAIFDLGRGGDVKARPDADMGYQAAAAAFDSGDHAAVERGNVGGGTGAGIARGEYKGGVGTSSITLDGGVIVGALAVVNALGTPLFRAEGPQPSAR